jgi:hypothetical protein
VNTMHLSRVGTVQVCRRSIILTKVNNRELTLEVYFMLIISGL